MNLEDKFRKLRTAARLSHTEVAQRVGVNQSTYSSWEAGHTRPKLIYYPKLAAAFGIAVTELFPEEVGATPIQDNTQGHLSEERQRHYEEVIVSLKEALHAKEALIVHQERRIAELETELKK